MECKELSTFLQNVSVSLYASVWERKSLSPNDFDQHITRGFSVTLRGCAFDSVMFTDFRLIDPVFKACKDTLEPQLIKGPLSNPTFRQNLVSKMTESANKGRYGLTLAFDVLKMTLRGATIPVHSLATTKKQHATFHYFCLGSLYLLCRIAGLNQRDSYFSATRYARLSATGSEDVRLVGSYKSAADIKDHCEREGLLFNVCMHALSDVLPDGYRVTRSFCTLRKSNTDRYKFEGLYLDDGRGAASRIVSGPLFAEIIAHIMEAISQQASGQLRFLKAKQSIQHRSGRISTSLRFIAQYDDYIVLKATQVNYSSVQGIKLGEKSV